MSKYMILKGGSWVYRPYVCRSAFRGTATRDLISSLLGFRVVCVLPRTHSFVNLNNVNKTMDNKQLAILLNNLESVIGGLNELSINTEAVVSIYKQVANVSINQKLQSLVKDDSVCVPTSNVGDFEINMVDIPDKDYSVSATTITQKQWREIANRTDLKCDIDLKLDPSYFKGDNLPVESINWYEAVEFCKRLSKLTGETYELPTVSQWEYACNAGSNSEWCFGDDENLLGDYAWYNGNSGSKTHPVGQLKSNVFGLYDMHGNVWEWTSSEYVD